MSIKQSSNIIINNKTNNDEANNKTNDDEIDVDKTKYNKIDNNEINNDETKYNKINDDKINDDKINDDKINDNKINDNKINDNKINENKINENKVNENKVNEKYNTLVCSGGGMKGFALIGALEYLHEHKYLQNINTFAGTSIGGIVSSLMIVGYEPSELFKVLSKIKLFKMKNQNVYNIINAFGIDDGRKLEIVLKKLLTYKKIDPDITLKELFDKTNKKIILTTTCINDKSVKYLSYENYPSIKLITALRMSSAIPFYFTPVLYDNKYFIDGGCIDEYPMHLFDDNEQIKSTLGIYLTSQTSESKIENAEDFFSGTIKSILEGVVFNSKRPYKNNTIDIELSYSDVGFMNYNLDVVAMKHIHKIGYDTAKIFFNE
jgi:predicted acylesterase/phospholipase RssA